MQKWKLLFIRSSSALLATYLFIFTSVSSFAAPQSQVIEEDPEEQIEVVTFEDGPQLMLATSSGSSDAKLFDTAQWLYQHWNDAWRAFCRNYVAASDAIVGTYMDFHLWLEDQFGEEETDQIFEDYPTVEENSDGYVVPEQIQQYVINYVTYCIQQNPLSYKECYIYSYNFLNPSQFTNYGLYESVKEFIKNSDGFVCIHGENRSGAWDPSLRNTVYVIPKTVNYGFYGSTTSGGFTNVQLAVNWQTSTTPQNLNSNIKVYTFNASGQFTQENTGYRGLGALYNISSIKTGSTTDFTIFTNSAKNEPVYVFNNLNALKNYNAGLAQPYYFTEQGISTPITGWTASGEFIAGGDLTYYGQSYQTISTQTQSGWTAEQVLELVQLVMTGQGSGGGSGGGSGDGSDFDLGFLGTIGRLIGSLITGVGNLIAGIAEGIVNIIVGSDGNGGIVGTIRNVLSSLTELVNTDFTDFLSSVFDFLPTEIITCITATFMFALLFGIVKLIRG